MFSFQRRALLIWSMAVGLYSSTFSQDKDPSALTLKLSLEKETYLVDEPIFYEVVEQNISDRPISTSPMSPSFDMFYTIKLINSKGETLRYKGGSVFPHIVRSSAGVILAPGEKQYDVRDILGIFGNSDEAHGFSFYLPSDTYRIKAIHRTNYHAPIDWHDALEALNRRPTKEDLATLENMTNRMPIESNEVTLEVVEPIGLEKEVHRKLLHLYRIREPIRGREPVEIIPLLNEIVEKYPQSVYAQAAYERMSFFLNLSHRGQTLWSVDTILTKYPNSFFIYGIITFWLLADEEKEFVSLKSKYPNTKIEEYSQHQIDQMKKKNNAK